MKKGSIHRTKHFGDGKLKIKQNNPYNIQKDSHARLSIMVISHAIHAALSLAVDGPKLQIGTINMVCEGDTEFHKWYVYLNTWN